MSRILGFFSILDMYLKGEEEKEKRERESTYILLLDKYDLIRPVTKNFTIANLLLVNIRL